MSEILIFDLFGTLVFFDGTRIPVAEIGGRRIPMTVPGLADHVAELLPGVSPREFLGELKKVSAAVGEEKRREGIELHTSVRFERTLRSLGASGETSRTGALRLAALHMDSLARSVVCPPARASLLARLAESRRLALLSNFDDGATARRVLREAGLDAFFESIVISEEEGLRKPARAIFERSCERLGAEPARCLYVGDTLVEDIEGATAAGLAAVWVHPDPHAESPALAVIADVDDLPAWLEGEALSARGGASR